ncbi:MAG: hypothetical protein ACYC3X_30875 [Pirellulaceae bacterium]
MLKYQDIRDAIENRIRFAANEPSGDWHAITLWPDGHLEMRCGTGPMHCSEDEYRGVEGTERTIYSIDGWETDAQGDWADIRRLAPDLDDDILLDGEVDQILDKVCEDDEWWDELKATAEAMGLEVDWA